MTDLDAIRARHVRSKVKGVVGYEVCHRDGDEWPCDLAIVLAALDGMSFDAKAFADVVVQRNQALDALGDAQALVIADRLAAEAREQRLRADFVKRINESIGGIEATRIIAMFDWAAAAALATTPLTGGPVKPGAVFLVGESGPEKIRTRD